MTRLEHDWFPRPLPDNVEIGPRSWLHSSHAFQHYGSRRDPGVRIGHDSGVYVGTYFELGPHGSVEIGNYCSIVGAIIATDGDVVIGDHTFIAHEVVIADHPVATPPGVPPEPPGASRIEIGHTAWVGARAVLLAGARLGEGAVVGAGAVVDFDVPPHATVAGNPARIIGA
jgi:acetyltransferase-like isoleucine patch superfamily enzyme